MYGGRKENALESFDWRGFVGSGRKKGAVGKFNSSSGTGVTVGRASLSSLDLNSQNLDSDRNTIAKTESQNLATTTPRSSQRQSLTTLSLATAGPLIPSSLKSLLKLERLYQRFGEPTLEPANLGRSFHQMTALRVVDTLGFGDGSGN